MNFDLNRYSEELLADADNLTPEQRELVKTVLTGGKVGQRLSSDVMARSDYSRSKDELDRQRAADEAERQRLREWHQGEQAKIDKANEILRRAQDTGRDPNGQFVSPSSIEALEQRLADMQRALDEKTEKTLSIGVSLTEDIHYVSDKYRELFGKSAPLSEIREHAMKNGLSLRHGFEDFIRPALDAKKEEEWKQREKEIYERGKNDGMTLATNPATLQTTRLSDHNIFGSRDHIKLGDKPFSQLSKEEQEEASARQFEEEWNKSKGFRDRSAFGS